MVEGCGRCGVVELARFLKIGMGSASELEHHLLLARDLGFIDSIKYKELEDAVIEVKCMLASLIQKLTAES